MAYTYGKIENNTIKHFAPYKGGLKVDNTIVINATEAQYNQQGWYRIENIAEDGVPTLEGNIIKNYIGKPYVPTEKEVKTKKIDSLKNNIGTYLYDIVQKMQGNKTEGWKKVQSIINEIDELGKVVQTLEGNGSMENPFKGWKVGMPVEEGMWYLTEGGYLWEAIKSGTPTSELDKEYFDVIGV